MGQPKPEPELHAVPGGWVAEREGVRVLACCGQEALLRLNLQLIAHSQGRHGHPASRLIVEEVQPPLP